MKPRSVTIESPKQQSNGRYVCNVVAIYPNGAVYSQTTAPYITSAAARRAAKGVQLYLQHREDKDDQS
jgi:hypothetical protein